MARLPRKFYDTSFFHIMVQGINKEYIFKKENYIVQYLKLLNQYKSELNIEIIAYCIMSNHVHILIYTQDISKMSQYMQRVNSNYAKYYNYMKNGRKGYVFRDRFVSEPIMNEKYLMRCINYIHLNPVKAGMVKKCEDYKYSSYIKYINGNQIKLLRNLFNINIDIEDFKNIKDKYIFKDIDIEEDKVIQREIEKYLEVSNISKDEILKDRILLKLLIKHLKSDCNIKYVNIMKFLNITKGQMERLKK